MQKKLTSAKSSQNPITLQNAAQKKQSSGAKCTVVKNECQKRLPETLAVFVNVQHERLSHQHCVAQNNEKHGHHFQRIHHIHTVPGLLFTFQQFRQIVRH